MRNKPLGAELAPLSNYSRFGNGANIWFSNKMIFAVIFVDGLVYININKFIEVLNYKVFFLTSNFDDI